MSEEENNQIRNLEERRKNILEALDNGKEISSSDMDFLLDQFLNTNNVNLGARGQENLKKILAGNIQESFKSVSEDLLKNAVKTTKQAYLGAETMGNPDIAREVTLDFGFKDLQADLEKAKAKDNFYELIKEAQKCAIETRYNGTAPNNALANGVREAREGLKWHQFRRKRLAKKAEKNLDPSAYWSTKAANGNAVTSKYYAFRSWIAERRNKKGQRLSDKLQESIKNRKEYSELKWFSRDFRKKLGLRAKIAFSRSPEKLMKKVMKKGNLEDVKGITDKEWLNGESLKDAAKKLNDKKAEGYSMTKAELKTLEMYNAVLKDCKTAETYINNVKNSKLNDVKLLKDPKAKALENKFKKKMEKTASGINKDAIETFKKSPMYKALVQLNGGKEPKLENIVSGKDVFKQVLEANGYSQEQIEGFMDQYYPKNNNNQQEETEGQQQTEVQEEENKAKEQENEEKNNDNNFSHSAFDKNKGHEEIVSREVDGKKTVFYKCGDGYGLDTGDKTPSVEDYKMAAEGLLKSGVKEIGFNLDNIPPEQLALNLQVFADSGLKIKNEEAVRKAIKSFEEEKKQYLTGEKKKDEKGGEEKIVPEAQKEEITKAAKEGNTDRWTENDAISISQMKDKKKMMETDAFKRLPKDVQKNVLLMHDLKNGTLKKKDGSEIKLTDKQKSIKMGECIDKIRTAHEKAFPKDKGEKRTQGTAKDGNIIGKALQAQRQNG